MFNQPIPRTKDVRTEMQVFLSLEGISYFTVLSVHLIINSLLSEVSWINEMPAPNMLSCGSGYNAA